MKKTFLVVAKKIYKPDGRPNFQINAGISQFIIHVNDDPKFDETLLHNCIVVALEFQSFAGIEYELIGYSEIEPEIPLQVSFNTAVLQLTGSDELFR